MIVHCTFYVRTPSTGGGYRYNLLDMPLPTGGAGYPMSVPPAVGDVMANLPGDTCCRVVDRQWNLPEYGSAAWPTHVPGPLWERVTVIMEPSDGVFAQPADKA